MTRIASALLAAFFLTGQLIGAVHDGATITTTEFAALDRSRTAVIIPGGILEEHGPYPSSRSARREG
jgi:hypothetical protein